MTTETIARKIPLSPVKSSLFTAVGYDADRRILALQYGHGPIYHMADVSAVNAAHFLSAESLGGHFNKNMKGKFHSEKMTADCPACGAKHGWIGETCSDCGTATYAAPAPKEQA